MAPWMLPAAMFAGTALTNAFNLREARKNRAFQERMSSTSHQREVLDLRAAGINPMFRGMGGAPAPAGDRAQLEDPVGPAVSTALQEKLLKAQIQLAEDQALKTRTEAGAIQMEWNAGRFERLVSENEAAQLTTEQLRQMIPIALERARAEVDNLASSARAARARAALDEASRQGYLNEEQFQKDIGQMGPWARQFFLLLTQLRRRN